MALFVTNASSTLAHDVYAVDIPVPAVVQAVGTDVSIAVGQFPWGPAQALTYPGGGQATLQQFAPAGMLRTGSAYLSLIRKAWPSLGILRIADTTALQATCQLKQGVALVATLTAISIGSQGNSLIATVGPANDGNSNHYNLTVSVSSASGTTSETYVNLDASTGNNTPPNLTGSVLVGTYTFNAPGIPSNGNTIFSGGTDGTVTAASYVGTPGGSDRGFSLLEADDTIGHVFTDDPGNALRVAINNGLVAHGELTTDRMVYLNGNSGQTAAQAQADAANYRSIRAVYVDPWAFVFDDVTGAMRLAPSSCWAASVASQLPPSTSIAWKSDVIAGLMAGVAQLEFNRTAQRAQNTAAGITTLRPRKRGGTCFEAAVNTSQTPGVQSIVRTRMGQYMAKSVTQSWEPYVDAPNIPAFQQDLVNSLDHFLGQLQNNYSTVNAAFVPFILNYMISPTAAANTATSIQGGNFNVNAQVTLGAPMSRIFLNLQYGESVIIQAA